jgi:hypothetical protein
MIETPLRRACDYFDIVMNLPSTATEKLVLKISEISNSILEAVYID